MNTLSVTDQTPPATDFGAELERSLIPKILM